MKQDVAALDTLLDDEMSYVRTSGGFQSRPEFIDAIKEPEGRLRVDHAR